MLSKGSFTMLLRHYQVVFTSNMVLFSPIADSESDIEDVDEQSESQQSTQDSEDSQAKDGRLQEQEDAADREPVKAEDDVVTLTKMTEEKPTFNEDSDDGPPTLKPQVGPEARLQDPDSEAPKVEEVQKTSEENEGARSQSKKEPKSRGRRSLEKERESSHEPVVEAATEEQDVGKKVGVKEEDEKIDETPVLERQVPVEADVKDKVEELKQEARDSASDVDKTPDRRKGRKKGRKSVDSRKRSKTDSEADVKSDSRDEPKKKHTKMDRRKSDKGKKSKEQELKGYTDVADSDMGSSSVEDRLMPGSSKPYMTTPPTTPESSPKMPSSPSQEEDLQIKGEEQSSNKSDSDALIEVASIDDRDASQTPGMDVSALTPTLTGTSQKKATPGSISHETSPKKRRRGVSESEPGKKRRKHSRRRKSSLSERRRSSTKDRGNNNSSDTDESRSESRLTSSSSSKHQLAFKSYSGSLSSKMAESSLQQGSEKQRRWNFLVGEFISLIKLCFS